METINLTISAQTLNAIGVALQELPFKLAKPAIDEIEKQVQKYLMEKQSERTGKGTDPAGVASGGAVPDCGVADVSRADHDNGDRVADIRQSG